jgi:AraC-like DNA-binding protein
MGVAPPLDSIRIEEKINPVVIDTEAILAMGMLSSLPPINLGLILATLSGVISIRVGKIVFPEVNRLAVKTRGAPMRGSISESPPSHSRGSHLGGPRSRWYARTMLGPRGSRIIDGDVFRRLVRARDYLTESYDTPVLLGDAARQAGMSPFHFLRSFSRTFGETPRAYVQRLRLERAIDRLARGASVTDVCFEVGYASLGSFSTLFAKRHGLPPSAWQRTVRRQVAVPEAIARLFIPCCYLYGVGLQAVGPS